MSITTLLYSQADQTIPTLPATWRFKPVIPIHYQAPPVPQQTRSQLPPSRLLSLPLEIRLQIYTLALHSTPLPSSTPLEPVPSHQHPLPLLATHHRLALLLVNRQIYNEARLLPFTTNTFLFRKSFGSSVYAAKKFLGQLERWQREAVRRLEVSVVGRWEEELGVVCGLLGGGEGRGCVVVVRVGKEIGWEEFGEAGAFAWMGVMAMSYRQDDSWVRGMIEKGVKREGVTMEFIWA